jgi:hypothetical protein
VVGLGSRFRNSRAENFPLGDSTGSRRIRDAHDRDYQVVIVEDACAAASEEEHQESIKLLGQIAKVVEVEGLVSL